MQIWNKESEQIFLHSQYKKSNKKLGVVVYIDTFGRLLLHGQVFRDSIQVIALITTEK